MTEQLNNLQELSVAEIYADPDFNCRGSIAPSSVIDLARSIDATGLQQPISVQPYTGKPPHKYRVLMGHRRLMAFKVLKRETIPSFIKTNLSEADAMIVNLIENLERQDLTLMQEAHAIARFHNVHMKQAEVAKRLNKPIRWVQIRYAALRLPPEVQAEIDAGWIRPSQIPELERLPSNEQIFAKVREIKDAKQRGEKIIIRAAKKKPLPSRRVRNAPEMYAMQDLIRETLGNNIGTRVLGWTSGIISDDDLYDTITELAKEQGKAFIPPVRLQA